MTTEKWAGSSFVSPILPGELITDYRTRLAAEQSHVVERRKQELAEQSSQQHTPDKRIRIWEQLHALTLPVEESHPLLKLIAKSTGLALEQIKEEQRQRAAAVKAGKQPERKVLDPYCLLPGAERKRGI